MKGIMVSSVYIHMPFCIRKCIYCDFFSLTADQGVRDRYVENLVGEISMRRAILAPAATFYMGGGTPTVLEPASVAGLMRVFGESSGFADGCETTIEANPGTVTPEQLLDLRRMGFNRLSLGVQSLHDTELALLGRVHAAEEALSAFHAARAAGFDNISIDLMYGLPGQVPATWFQTLEKAVACGPEHLSLYELTPEAGTPLAASLADGSLQLPDEESVLEMYQGAIDLLARAGYGQYEISNFARAGYACRHNNIYWDRVPYIGLGAGAHSFTGAVRQANVCDLDAYARMIGAGQLPVIEETPISPAEAIRETIFLGLRKREGIDFRSLPPAFAQALADAVAEPPYPDLAEIAGNKLRLTRRGLPLCNEVIVAILSGIEPLLPS